jgi:hypothetical protein
VVLVRSLALTATVLFEPVANVWFEPLSVEHDLQEGSANVITWFAQIKKPGPD